MPSPRFRLSHWLSLSLLLGLYLGHLIPGFFIDPPPWPDEAIIADTGLNLARHQSQGTSLWAGLVPGAAQISGWYPRLYFLLVGAWFSLLPFSLFHLRLLSAVAGGFNLLLVTHISWRLAPRLWWLAPLVLLSDYQFIRASRLGRPEIICLLFILAALALLLQLVRNSSNSSVSSFTVATLQTLSCLIHPLVAVFYLTALPLWHRHSTLIKSYLLGIMFILSLWFLMSIPYLHLILDQLALVVSRKQLELPWGWLVLVEEPWLLKIIYLLYLLLSLISFGLVWRHRRYQAAVLSLALLAGWLAGWLGRMVWYWIYLVPPLALTVTFWLPQLTPIKRLLVSLLLISLIAGNWLYSAQRFLYLSHRYKHLDQVLAQVAALIPHHSTVFLSSVPDAYFWLDRNQLTLRASPSNPVAAADLNRVLQTSQYLVFSEDLSRDITDAQVATYLRDHLVVAHQVSNHQGLDLYLAELQP